MKHAYFPCHISTEIGLIGIGLLTILLIITPVMAEMYISSPISMGIPDQSAVENTAVYGILSGNSLKSSSGPPYVNSSIYVGQYLRIYGWSQSGGPPIPNVTLSFQRSDDGITYCTIQTSVSNSSGLVQLQNYTESCPGIVYYRLLDEYGIDSDPYIVKWLQTDSPATCVPPPACSFSITCIENYNHMCDKNGTHCNIPGLFQECDNFKNGLEKAGYPQNFYYKDDEVTPEVFGTNPSYSGSTITGSAFHYHSGHGTDAGNLSAWTYLNLKDYDPDYPRFEDKVGAGDVAGNWGGKLKWVMLDSCKILRDDNWHKALTTSHGILGFSSDSGVNLTFPDTFLKYAIKENLTIVKAYKQATLDVYHDDNTTATVITRTIDQYNIDHFPGTNSIMAPDGDPNNDTFKIRHWNCRSGVEW
jgi:hypothetical protein